MSNFASVSNFYNSFKSTGSEVDGELVKGVDTDILIRFMADDENITSISKVLVRTYIKSRAGGDRQEFSFRDVSLRIDPK